MAQFLRTTPGTSSENAPALGPKAVPELTILPLNELPRLLEHAITATSSKRLPIPAPVTPEPEFLDGATVKSFAYRALARVAEHYWNEILAWRRRNPDSLGLALPGTPAASREEFLTVLTQGATLANPGAISLNLMQQIKLLTSTFAKRPYSEQWLENAQNDAESEALAAYLSLSPVEFRLAAGLNSAFARTFELQAALLNALAEKARSQDPRQAYAALSVLLSPELLAAYVGELHKLLKFLSSVHFDHFKVVNDWMNEQTEEKRLFVFAQSTEHPELRIGVSPHAADELLSRISSRIPLSIRHGCPVSAARTLSADGLEARSVMRQAFTWIEEINTTLLFPLVAELYSRQAPSMTDSVAQ